MIAEDLGVITPPVERLRDELGLPGMDVLQFACRGNAGSPHRLENHRENGVVYTGTHDNDTAVGWWSSLGEDEQEATGLDPGEPHWCWSGSRSPRARGSRSCPSQDVLGLGSEARMNTPGTEEGNWEWRLEPGVLTPALAKRLRGALEATNRLGRGEQVRLGPPSFLP